MIYTKRPELQLRAFVYLLCNKNPGPLLVVFILYAIFSLIGELVY